MFCLVYSLKCLFNFRDESSSATFYFREHTEPGTKQHPSCDIAKPVSDNLEEVWMYYRVLKPGENEFPLRNKQVRKSPYSLHSISHASHSQDLFLIFAAKNVHVMLFCMKTHQ